MVNLFQYETKLPSFKRADIHTQNIFKKNYLNSGIWKKIFTFINANKLYKLHCKLKSKKNEKFKI